MVLKGSKLNGFNPCSMRIFLEVEVECESLAESSVQLKLSARAVCQLNGAFYAPLLQ